MSNDATCMKCGKDSKTTEKLARASLPCVKCQEFTWHLVSTPQKTTNHHDLAALKEKQKV